MGGGGGAWWRQGVGALPLVFRESLGGVARPPFPRYRLTINQVKTAITMDRTSIFYIACALGLIGLLSVPTARSLLLGLDPPAVETAVTEIAFAGWGNTHEVAMLRQLIDEFERDNAGLKVKFIHIQQNYDAVLTTMMAGRRAPDIFYISPSMLGSMLAKRVLLNLSPYLEKSAVVRLEDFFPQTVEPYRWDGRRFGRGPVYGLCKDWSPDYLVYYNKDLFEKEGIDLPDGSWTREEFVDIAQRLTKRDERGRTVQFGVYNNCNPEQWIWQSGGRIFSEDRTRVLLESAQVIEALEFAAGLSTRWRVAPGYAEQAQSPVNVMFETGRVAMCFYGQWFAPQFRKNIKNFAWGVVTPPRAREDVYVSGGMVGYGIYAYSERAAETWRFMEYLVGPQGQEAIARIGWNIPAHKATAYGPVFVDNPDLDGEVTRTFLRAAEKTRLFQHSPYITSSEFRLHFNPEWELVMLGEKSVAEAMRDATRRINQAIRDNRALLKVEAGS